MTYELSTLESGARSGLPRLDFELPQFVTRAQGAPRSRASLPVGLLMFGIAILLAARNDAFRRLEADMITPGASLVTGRHGTVTADTIVYFALGTTRAFGLDVTNECTSALLLIPLFVMMGSFAIFTRLPLRRQLLAVVTGTTLILATNMVRVAGIAWSTWKFGYDPGYTYSHVFVGSAFSLIGFVGAMLIALWLLVRGERYRRPAPILPSAAPGQAVTVRAVTARPLPRPQTRRPRPALVTPRPGPRPSTGRPWPTPHSPNGRSRSAPTRPR